MKDINLVSDEELIVELSGRYINVIFYGEKTGIGSLGKDKSEGTFHFEGELTKLLGLCERMKKEMFKSIDREEL